MSSQLLVQVKPLGVLAMIDDGELDWKIIAINSDDAKASSVNDIEDVERYLESQLPLPSLPCLARPCPAWPGPALPCLLSRHTDIHCVCQAAVQRSSA